MTAIAKRNVGHAVNSMLGGKRCVSTPWSEALCSVVEKFIDRQAREQPRIRFADIGAGPAASIAARAIEKFGNKVNLEVVCIEPNFNLSKICQQLGAKYVRSLFDKSVGDERFDLLAFNPPVLPSRYLTRKDEARTIFNGGRRGYDVLSEVLSELPDSMAAGGVAIILWPTLLPPPQHFSAAGSIQDKCRIEQLLLVEREDFRGFTERAPVRARKTDFERWLKASLQRYLSYWKQTFPSLKEDEIGLVAAIFRRRKD